MKKIIIAISLLLCLGMLTGCSQGNQGNSTALRVGMECDYAPFNWTVTEQGEYTQPINSVDYADGYDVVIASMIAESLGREVQIVKLDWDSLILSLQNDEIDLVIAGMTDTPARREEVN